MDKTYFSSDFKLGILGGGQLGKMLLSKTQDWDIQTAVLDPNENAPARIGCNHFTVGSLQDFDTVYNFGKGVDLLTIEIENVNVEALAKLQMEGVKVYPKPETLHTIKNKIRQKEFYRNHKIPTSKFISFNSRKELEETMVEQEMQLPFVWKAAEGGYDGRGVQIVRTKTDLANVPDVPGLVEDLIQFEKEIAIIVARTPDGKTCCFPTVEMEFHPEANMVEYVFSPGQLTEHKQHQAQQIAVKVAEELNHVGLLAVEMFTYGEHGILVNEVAPRVHNSGHLTIEGNITSQFEQHLRAILNLPLGDTSIIKPSAMVNLNGAEGFEGPVYYKGMEEALKIESLYVHLYGKAETRPFRKMGHVTVLGESLQDAKNKAKLIKDTLVVQTK